MGIRMGPSVLLSLGAAMTTPPLSKLRNSFPLFAFLLMLQIANSFLLLLSLSLHWGEKNPHLFKQALYKSLLQSEVSWTHFWIKHHVAVDTGRSCFFFCSFKFALPFTFVFCRAGISSEVKKHSYMETVLTQIAFAAQVFGAFLLPHCQVHVVQTTYSKGLHSNCSDALIAFLFAAQVPCGFCHYLVVTNSSPCTLYESVMTYQSVN